MKFSEIPQFLLETYIDRLNNYSYSKSYKGITNSYVWGLNRRIITKGGNLIECYIKHSSGFKKIVLQPQKVDGNKFLFTNKPIYDYDDNSTYIEVSGLNYYFKIYSSEEVSVNRGNEENCLYPSIFNITKNKSNINIEPDQEIYIRKDSVFHQWLEDYANDVLGEDYTIRNFINTDKAFIYFGSIYPTYNEDDGYRIYHEGMKDYALKCVPTHQQTDKLKILFDMYFDKVYQEIYNKIKDIWTLLDPNELDEIYLDYFAKYYKEDTKDSLEYDNKKREFLRDVVNLLKRKGTYSSLYSIYKFITSNTQNRMNIYERWHDDTLTQVTESDWTDYLYQVQYNYGTELLQGGAGEQWYKQFIPVLWNDNSYIYTFRDQEEIEINHELSDYPVVQVYNNEYYKIVPAQIVYNDKNQTTVTFNSEVTGFVLLKKSDKVIS